MTVSEMLSAVAVREEVVEPVVSAAPEAPTILHQAFGGALHLVSKETGELVHRAVGQPEPDWDIIGPLCVEVARRGQPEFVAEESPLIVLAVPIAGGDSGCVAVGTFLTKADWQPDELALSAASLGMSASVKVVGWASHQIAWEIGTLRRMAAMVLQGLENDWRIEEIKQLRDRLTSDLESTCEELHLLHGLADNLNLSKNEEDLGGVALTWLSEVVPAEGLGILLLPTGPMPNDERATSDLLASDARREPILISRGTCPVDTRQFSELVDRLTSLSVSVPIICNRSVTSLPDWPTWSVRQVMLVPLARGDSVSGWLGVFNHADGGKFGASEASLLNSVGAILGIHGGNIQLYRDQAEILSGIIRSLTSAIDAKDPYTCGHSDRVARIALALARDLGCDDAELQTIYLAGLLHDVGKIGIDDAVLRKPGKLTDEEFDHIKTHVGIGHRILQGLGKLVDVLPVVLHHHESWDGSGYPYNLMSDRIPKLARVVAVADAFDAMASDRPYRRALYDERIDEIFRAGAGQQWDPEVVAAFFRLRRVIGSMMEQQGEGPMEIWFRLRASQRSLTPPHDRFALQAENRRPSARERRGSNGPASLVENPPTS